MPTRRLVLGSVLLVMLAPLAAAYAGGGKCSADAQTCLNHQATGYKNAAWLGIEKDKDAATGAWVVTRVLAGSPAEKAGMKAGDHIVAVNGKRLSKDMTEAQMKELKAGLKAGASASYTVLRDGQETQLTAALTTMPDEVLARMVGEHMLTAHVTAAATAIAEEKKEKKY